MPRVRDQAARRKQILDAATRHALQRGLVHLRIKDVADDLGITQGAVLYYYESADELRLKVYSRAAERCFEAREAALDPHAPAKAQLVSHAEAGFTLAVPELRLMNEPVSGVHVQPAYRAIAESLFVREVSRYQVILERGAASGEFSLRCPSLDAARNLVSLEENYRLHMLAGTAIQAPVGLRLVLSYAELVTQADLVERLDSSASA